MPDFLIFSFFTSLVFLQRERAVKFPLLFYLKQAIQYQKLLLHKMPYKLISTCLVQIKFADM